MDKSVVREWNHGCKFHNGITKKFTWELQTEVRVGEPASAVTGSEWTMCQFGWYRGI